MGKSATTKRPKRVATLEFEARVLKACRGTSFRSASTLAEILSVNPNTLRAHYLYPMAAEGRLETQMPLGTRRRQGYRTTCAQRRAFRPHDDANS